MNVQSLNWIFSLAEVLSVGFSGSHSMTTLLCKVYVSNDACHLRRTWGRHRLSPFLMNCLIAARDFPTDDFAKSSRL